MPPKRLKIAEVPPYVREKWDLRISRTTANNWVTIGLRGVKLKTIRIKDRKRPWDGVTVTTAAWVDEFVITIKAGR